MRIPPSLFDIPSRLLADAFNIRYSTKYYDAESDLYYYGYRYYAPGPTAGSPATRLQRKVD